MIASSKWLHLCTVAGGLVLADQLSKLFINGWLAPLGRFRVIPGVFSLTYVQNNGVAFGILSGSPSGTRVLVLLFMALIAFFVIIFFVHRAKKDETVFVWGLSLICGGALGNQIDRMRLGAVVDFLDMSLGSHHWPVFNIADMGVTFGTALILIHLWRTR